MQAAVIYVTERSTLEANIPTAGELDGLFRVSLFPVIGKVRWIGPTLRIVRTASIGTIITHAAWLVEYEDPADVGRLLQSLNFELQRFSQDFSVPVAQPYTPGLHGSLEWWASGNAARTKTRDLPASMIRLLTPNDFENPVGPDVSRWTDYLFYGLGAAAIIATASAVIYTQAKSKTRPRQLPAPRRLPSAREG